MGLNLVYLVPGETGGMETYARELIPALLAERPDLRITAFVNREAGDQTGPWSDLATQVVVPVRARRRAEWIRGEQLLLPRFAKRAGVGIVHSLASTAPGSGSFRRVVTIHDLIYHLFPEAHTGVRSKGMAILVPLAARRSQRIITPSVSTRDDLVRLLKIPEEKIDVVPEGLGSTRSEATPEPELRARLDLGERQVVLTASAKRPHKNLLRLLEAWALLPTGDRPVLVLPGYPTPHERELRERAAALGIEGDTRFVGWVSTADLEGLYRLAECFVYPSLYEGFGLPVLEAMARGVPVACSDRGSLGEVAGGAALMFDPESPRAIGDAVRNLFDDPGTRERLRAAGLERAHAFSWRATARATLRTYDIVLRETERR